MVGAVVNENCTSELKKPLIMQALCCILYFVLCAQCAINRDFLLHISSRSSVHEVSTRH